MVVCARNGRGIAGVLVYCPDQQRHHVSKVDGAGALKSLLVDSEKIHRIHKHLIILIDLGGEALRIQKALLRARDNVQYVDFLVPPHPPRVEDMPLLGRVPELEVLEKPGGPRAPSRMAKGKAVKRQARQGSSGCELKRSPNVRFHVSA